MSKCVDKIVSIAIGTVVGMGLGLASVSSAYAGCPDKVGKVEKCVGIVKAHKNDCGTAKHSCQGQAKVDGDANEWLYLPTGTCGKIVGGKVLAKKDKKG